MGNAGTEAQSAHLVRIQDPFGDRVDDPARPDMVTRQNPFEICSHVSASFEPDRPQIGPVSHAEVMERTEETFVEGLPKPHIACDPVVEPMDDVLSIGPFRGSGEPEQDLWSKSLQQPAIRRCLGVVELVDDNDVPSLRVNCVNRSRQGLNGGEDVLADEAAPLQRVARQRPGL